MPVIPSIKIFALAEKREKNIQTDLLNLRRTNPKIRHFVFKGGDPAPPSDRATLLRLHPSHRPYLGHLPPFGWVSDFG
jgi:hypothetical protein